MKKQESKGNTFGIIGLCLGWVIPIAGIIFGIISLVKKEDIKLLGIAALIVSVVSWIFWTLVIIGFISYTNTNF